MRAEHPAAPELRQFAAGRLAGESSDRVLAHLLTPCPRCRGELRRLLFPRLSETGEAGASPAAQMAGGPDADALGEAVRRQVARLLAVPPAERSGLLAAEQTSLDPALLDRLVEEARQRLSSEVREAVRIAELAVEVVERLAASRLGSKRREDLRLRAWVEVGRARRRASDLRGAERALARARQDLGAATDPLVEGLLLEEQGLLWSCQNRFDEAAAVLDRAQEIYLGRRDFHLVGTVLVRKASARIAACEPREAVTLLLWAGGLVDPQRQPRWIFALHHNLAVALIEAGQCERALGQWRAGEPYYRRLGRPADFLRLRWAQGKLMLCRDRIAEAKALLTEARQGFLALDLTGEAAGVSLDLAAACLRQPPILDLRRLAVKWSAAPASSVSVR